MKRIICWIFGHEWHLIGTINMEKRTNTGRVECVRCGKVKGLLEKKVIDGISFYRPVKKI
jgi:hypothetical protein